MQIITDFCPKKKEVEKTDDIEAAPTEDVPINTGTTALDEYLSKLKNEPAERFE